MSQTFYIVDGSGYIFRAYYAVQPLSNSEGLPTNALFGFSRMLVKLLKESVARHIAVTFDRPEPTFRHQLYSEYKANRGECPEDLVLQMPYFRKIVEALGIRSLETPGFEADDIIATLVDRYKTKFEKIVVVSGDKDLTQLVDGVVTVWDAMRDISYTPEKVEEKFGVKPSQVRDYLALRGDSSDNIPGVKGVGDKTAQALVKHFGSVASLIREPERIQDIDGLRGKGSVEKKVREGSDLLRMSYELVGLDSGVEPYNSDIDTDAYAWLSPNQEMLTEVFSKLGLEKLLSNIPSPEGVNEDFSPKAVTEGLKAKKYTLLSTESFPSFIKKFSKVEEFAFDTETTSLNIREAKLLGISFSWKEGEAWYLPLKSSAEPGLVLEANAVREQIGPIFSNPEVKKVGQNLKYDFGVLEENGYTIRGLAFDSMLASHLLEPDGRQHGLKKLSERYLSEEMREYKEVLGDAEHLGELPLADVTFYASHDADASWGLYQCLKKLLDESGHVEDSEFNESSLTKVLDSIEMPLIPVLSKMERAGVRVDVEFLKGLQQEFSEELIDLEKTIISEAGVEFNLNSPKQLSRVLFEDMGISTKGVKKTKSGFSTDASVLAKLAPLYPFVAKILEYRELFKLNSTYVEALLKLADSKTQRIHSSFNQAITATGRLSSSEPNLQNIPIRTSQGKRLRQAFVAKKGYRLLTADYSQIELRILAHLSEDVALCHAFQSGEDIHLSTAKEIFGGDLMSDEELLSFRRVAKTINFGIVYGISAFRLARQLNVSNRQAQDYINDYFGRYPGVKSYFERMGEFVEKNGYAETLYGRKRFLEQINLAGRDRGYAKRSILNAPIQGTAAEIIKIAMINIDKWLSESNCDAKLVLQVHDELVLECSEDNLSEVEKMMVFEMENAAQLSVPLRVDYRRGVSWA